tara:strand:+ start:4623 stop:7010 length:2388 start_codon:yes stop_codon:yes gene_type:complete
MKFTLSWLKEHIKLNNNPAEIAKILTDLGLEVENFQPINPSLMDMLVCELKSIKKHPNADRLSLCEVTSGKENYNVVCGAGNLYEGMKTVFAPNGTFIPGKMFKLEKKSIRGVEGDGMLCSEEELCLSENSAGIIDLGDTFEVGKSYGSYFEKDYIFEIGLTPNRGDCASVKGIARELAAKLSKQLIKKEVFHEKDSFKSEMVWDLSSLSNKKDCPLIIGREFKIEKNPKSPVNFVNKLIQIGINPNSMLVDITNYILFDLGRPLHVFDLDKIEGNLKVRRANNEESFIGLDNKTYNLTDKDLVIADDKKIVSLAGVMGSANSCVDSNTKKVFLEVAYFDPDLISKTGRRHNIITDARYRFERGVDKNGLLEGLSYATEMIINFCHGSYSQAISAGNSLEKNHSINYKTDTFKTITGYSISTDLQINYLERLGFEIKKEKSFFSITAPTWRHDIFHANDIVEEVVRLDGYDNIPYENSLNNDFMSKESMPFSKNIEIDLREKLAHLGLDEIKSFTFISPKKIIPDTDYKEDLRLVNPISNELSVMRNSLYPNLLDSISRNYAKGFDAFAMFEIGDIFRGIDYSKQEKFIGLVLSGYQTKKNWYYNRRFYDFFDMKAIILDLIKIFSLPLQIDFIRSKSEYYHPGKSADIIINNEHIGSLGELHPKLMKKFQIKQQTVLGTLEIESLLKNFSSKVKSKEFNPSPFLNLKKDFSFILPNNVKVGDLINSIKSSNDIIGEVLVFDIYNNIENNDKRFSVGVEVEILQKDKVFNAKEINEIMHNIILKVKKEVNGELRV